MKIIFTILVLLSLCTNVLASSSLNNDIVKFDTAKAIKEAKNILSKKHPKYNKADLRLVEVAARYRPSESKTVYIEVSFINMDTIGKVKKDPEVWSQPSTGKTISGLIYEHIVIKLISNQTSSGSVNIINMKYPGTKQDLMRSVNGL